jgi:hypothetical protein
MTIYKCIKFQIKFVYHGLPNFSLPLIDAAGESLYGEPFAFVDIPPGKTYDPGLLEISKQL